MWKNRKRSRVVDKAFVRKLKSDYSIIVEELLRSLE